jgi:hypothetical protein
MNELIFDDYTGDFESVPQLKQQEDLEKYKEDARAIAVELRYPQQCLDRIDICKSIVAVNNVLAYYRRRI